MKRKRILFVGEAVTLAHVVRPLQLMRGLDQREYETVFACDSRYKHLFDGERKQWVPIESISRETFRHRLYRAAPLYNRGELQAYIQTDLRLLAKVKPDVVVSDFRVSMGIAAELLGMGHVALSNVHWSPSLKLPCPTPEHPLVSLVGVGMTRLMMYLGAELVFALQARGFNRLRKAFGLKALKGGIRDVYTHGTRTLYLDIPELYDQPVLEQREKCVGPVVWNVHAPLPEWWEVMPRHLPSVFVCVGSSGNVDAMRSLLETLSAMHVTVFVAGAGRLKRSDVPEGIYLTDYLAGPEAVKRADVVVCNGGSGMVYLSLAGGKPILGIPSNADQHYVMDAVQRQGAGIKVRSDGVCSEVVQDAVNLLIRDASYKAASVKLKQSIQRTDAIQTLQTVIDELCEEHGKKSSHQKNDIMAFGRSIKNIKEVRCAG